MTQETIPEQPVNPLPCYVGIDIGGTRIKAGVVREDGTVLANAAFPIKLDAGRDFPNANAPDEPGPLRPRS